MANLLIRDVHGHLVPPNSILLVDDQDRVLRYMSLPRFRDRDEMEKAVHLYNNVLAGRGVDDRVWTTYWDHRDALKTRAAWNVPTYTFEC